MSKNTSDPIAFNTISIRDQLANEYGTKLEEVYGDVGEVSAGEIGFMRGWDARELEVKLLRDELALIKAERDRVASGKVTCADCGSILARF